MSRTLFFDSQYGLDSYACMEDGKLTEYRAETQARGALIGNIYKGKVTDVLNGMQAAFVDCGLERHCYIAADDLVPSGASFSGEEIDIPAVLNLHEGDEIMVQVIKVPTGKKGAKVTTKLSFVGKYTVFLPNTPFVGVSAKIADGELRKNLIFSAKRQLSEGEGVIVRTAAPYAVLSEKVSEANYYRKLYQGIKNRFKKAEVGELLYSDAPLYNRVLRDNMLLPSDEIIVGTKELGAAVKELLALSSVSRRIKLTVHDPHTDLLYSHGIYEQFKSSLLTKVPLDNGAHLVIEHTEALTSIDVNTGKFTGSDSLEHTVYYTNILAAREIARQVKLRNIGGIFIVDFIDMTDENHRAALVAELEKELTKDSSKCKVLPMSKFGLVEFTRKRTGVPASVLMLKPCKICGSLDRVRSAESILCEFRARLLDLLSKGAATVCADINYDVAIRLFSYTELKENVAVLYPQARVYVVSHRTYREDYMNFRALDGGKFTLPEGTVLLY